MRERVTAARLCQAERFRGTRMLTSQLAGAGQQLMQAAMRQLYLSARAYHRVPKLARMIAELASAAEIGPAHLAEAAQEGSVKDWRGRENDHLNLRRLS